MPDDMNTSYDNSFTQPGVAVAYPESAPAALELRRLRAPFVVLGGIVFALGLYGVTINAALGRDNPVLLAHDHTDFRSTSVEVGAKRLLGISRDLERSPSSADQPFGVLVGASTLHAGVDPARLSSELGDGQRWSNLVVNPYAYEMNLIIQLLYERQLRPREVVLVFSPGMLHTFRGFREQFAQYPVDKVKRYLLGLQLSVLKSELIKLTLSPCITHFPIGQTFSRW